MAREDALFNQNEPSRPAERRQELLEHYGVLGVPSGAALERLTSLASTVLGVPIALISLIGTDKQWFKACYGLDADAIKPVTPFCAYTLLAEGVMVVSDTLQDDRFFSNPLVTGEPHARFYAGAPLVSAEGLKFGTLCVIDTKPHRLFSEVQRVLLSDLAAVVVETLEARVSTRELHASEARYRIVAETASDAIITIDANSTVLYVNNAASKIFGYSADEMLGHNLDMVMPDYLRHLHQAAMARYLETGIRQMHWQAIEIIGLHRSGTEIPIEVSFGEHVQDGERKFTGIMRDVTERKRAERALAEVHDALGREVSALEQAKRELTKSNAQLAFDALHDRLTGLANRTLFLDRLGHVLERTSRRSEPDFAVMYLDSDHFKKINDSLGHGVGDGLLVELGNRLKACVRPGDTVARLGGDEFAILLEDTTSAESAALIANRVQHEVAKPFLLESQMVHTSLSIGIVMHSVSCEDAAGMLRDADLAMYRAKALGRARHSFFTEAMRLGARNRLTLENDLRGAVGRQELRVYYQPIVSLADDRLAGFEALVRWQHPRLGLVTPADFIPIAEETGFIIDIDRWVLRRACAQLSLWRRSFSAGPPLTVNVNLSSKQFLRPDLVAYVQRVLAETGVPPEALKLEVTESTLMAHSDEVNLIVQRLRAVGVKLYIDDFGTGYSSLSYLRRFQVDAVKIDQSFVSSMYTSPESTELVRTIIAMAQTLRLDVVAEGVETQAQLEQLRAFGCVYAQGYLFAQPLPEAEVYAQLNGLLNTAQPAHLGVTTDL